jgi:protein phosphatase
MNTPGGASALHWISGSATDKGRVRATNQDAYLDRPDLGIWAVADGMGGHSDGAVASRAIVEALSLVPRPRHLGTSAQAVREVLQRVNRRLLEQAAARPDGDLIGSTAVVLIALGHHCTVLWVGDSRAYRLRDGDLTQITVDHSQVQALIDGGLLSSGDADGHPLSNVLLRAVGSEQDLLVDGQVERLAAGDRYLLCSDGLYRELDGGTLAALLGTAPPSEVVQTLVHQACERGGRDNVTAVVIDFL